MNNIKNETFLVHCNEDIENHIFKKESLIKYAKLAYVQKGYYYHHYDKEKESFLFCRILNEKLPSITIHRSEKTLLYSFDDIENIQECDYNKIQENLKNELFKIHEEFYYNGTPKTYVLLANEGTGKSMAVLDMIERGMVYCAPDKKILEEKEKYLKEKGKEFLRISSNADIIYTIICQLREKTKNNEKLARELSLKYVSECKSVNKNFNAKKVNDFIIKFNENAKKENIQSLIENMPEELLYKLQVDQSEDNVVSLAAFLVELQEISDEEKKEILNYYNYLNHQFLCGEKILTCTTHKLKSMLQRIKYNRPLLVFSDEIVPDIHGNAQTVSPSDPYYSYILNFAKSNEFKTTLNPTVLTKIEEIKKSRNVENWVLIDSYKGKNQKGHYSIIEIKEKKWLTNNEITLVVLSTEEKTKLIFPDATFIDLRHTIDTENMVILAVDGFNKLSKGKYFKGHARYQIVEACAHKLLNIDNNNFICDGLGHSIENDRWNHMNVKGRNDFIIKLRDKKDETNNIGIGITNPHPENINTIKGFIYASSEELFENQLNLLDDFEDVIIKTIGTDQLHQAVGRLNGYRKINDSNKTFVVVNSNMLNKITPLYFTPYIFHVHRFNDSAELRKNFEPEHIFLKVIHILLNMKDDSKSESDNINSDECLNKNEIENLINIVISKLKTKNESYFNSVLLKIFKYFNRNLIGIIRYFRERLNQIRYIPKLISNYIEYKNNYNIYGKNFAQAQKNRTSSLRSLSDFKLSFT